MAYLDLREPTPAANLVPTITPQHDPVESAAFASTEWGVIAVAQHDGLASLSEPGKIGRAMAFLFGSRPAFQLADPKLETLRRLAVLVWNHGYAVPVSAVKAFRAAGYSVDQLELLFASISARRPVRGRRAFA
jgi:hypothetical protein